MLHLDTDLYLTALCDLAQATNEIYHNGRNTQHLEDEAQGKFNPSNFRDSLLQSLADGPTAMGTLPSHHLSTARDSLLFMDKHLPCR